MPLALVEPAGHQWPIVVHGPSQASLLVFVASPLPKLPALHKDAFGSTEEGGHHRPGIVQGPLHAGEVRATPAPNLPALQSPLQLAFGIPVVAPYLPRGHANSLIEVDAGGQKKPTAPGRSLEGRGGRV